MGHSTGLLLLIHGVLKGDDDAIEGRWQAGIPGEDVDGREVGLGRHKERGLVAIACRLLNCVAPLAASP